ncbi:MAG: PAP/fibrillin family protein [Cyanobacteria bacterium P01_G01_bin.67]
MQTHNDIIQREQAKIALKTALTAHNGKTTQDAVADAIAKLAVLNPTPDPAQNRVLLEGNWLLISAPNFPGKLSDEANRYVYTLDRLTFNQFEPVNLRVVIEGVVQPVWGTDKEKEYTYDIVIEFKIIDPKFPKLKGIVKNLAGLFSCWGRYPASEVYWRRINSFSRSRSRTN